MNSFGLWSEYFAKYTWERLKFVFHNKQAKLNETTITDDLIFQIYQKFPDQQHVVIMEHADDESRNGNDLEVVIPHRGLFIIYPMQAKRIYAEQKYPRFSHKGQIENFLRYAREIGGVPLYLLYNYSPKIFPHPMQVCGINLTTEHYGCTLVDAHYINYEYAHKLKKKNKSTWRIPTFSSLHHSAHALPWHLLFHNPECLLEQFYHPELFPADETYIIRQYTKPELLKDANWRVVYQEGSKTSETSLFKEASLRNKDYSTTPVPPKEDLASFSPRYRVLIQQ